MPTQLCTRVRNLRNHPIQVVKPSDFEVGSGREIDPQMVLDDPAFTLYCFDRENDTAIFVQSKDPAAVDSAPFYYQAQAEHAVGIVSMPFPIFHELASQIKPPSKGLIFVHSVGRCGSTLLSKTLASVPTVHSLSEPDDLTQLVIFKVEGKSSEEWLRRAILSSVKWRCKGRIGPSAQQVAIKTRSEVMVLADYFGSLFPEARHIFLYRDAVTWMQSYYAGYAPERDVYDAEANAQMEEGWSDMLQIIAEYRRDGAPMNAIQIRVLAWITCMEGYLRLRKYDLPLCAARFEDLTKEPMPMLRELYRFCEIENVDWHAVEEVLGRDSQAGTIFDREERRKNKRTLTPELIQDVRELVATRPLLRTTDVRVEGTIHPARQDSTTQACS